MDFEIALSDREFPVNVPASEADQYGPHVSHI